MKTNEDPIDRILSREEEILPSSGFAAAVMEAVRREASVPPPIPFPWKRAWPVFALAAVAIVVVLVVAVVGTLRLASTPASSGPVDWTAIWKLVPGWMSNPVAGWVAGSLLLAFVSVKFSMRLASR